MEYISPETANWILQVVGVAAASKPTWKLIDTLSNSVGAYYAPIKAGKIKKAEIIGAAEGEAEAKKIKFLSEVELRELAIKRLKESGNNEEGLALPQTLKTTYQELWEQNNFENVVRETANFLPEEVSDEKVNPDWTYRFINNSQKCSDKDMQLLWAKILAGEITTPGSFSLRTLAIVNNMSKEEAEIFAKVGKAALTEFDLSFILGSTKDLDILKSEFDIDFSDVLVLRELNLFLPGTLGLHYENTAETNELFYTYGPEGIIVTRRGGTPKQVLDVEFYTKSGHELLSLLDKKEESNIKYIKRLASYFHSPSVTVEYGKFYNEDNKFSVKNPTMIS